MKSRLDGTCLRYFCPRPADDLIVTIEEDVVLDLCPEHTKDVAYERLVYWPSAVFDEERR